MDCVFLTCLFFFDLLEPCRRQTGFARNGSILAWFGKGSWVSTVSIAEGFRSTWLGSMRNLRCGGVGACKIAALLSSPVPTFIAIPLQCQKQRRCMGYWWSAYVERGVKFVPKSSSLGS